MLLMHARLHCALYMHNIYIKGRTHYGARMAVTILLKDSTQRLSKGPAVYGRARQEMPRGKCGPD